MRRRHVRIRWLLYPRWRKENPLRNYRKKTNSAALADLFGDVFVSREETQKKFFDMVRAELVSYKKGDCLLLNSEDGCEVSDSLRWWKAWEDKYPLLSKHA
ncbi:hypothetical protein DPMN_095099 [Dreissena polymorpha]|uniref:Uncharacterized protein n=1 Tax=Dreissena polymorpha TaxID=45954 RepID=A0A9D4R3H1_DREPO|nr:hypothetical protein DPMN_095099 [Dreissena polymorpha]